MFQETTKRIPYTNAPLSPALIHWCGGNERIIKRRKEVYGGGDCLNDYARDLGVLGCSANDLFSSGIRKDRGDLIPHESALKSVSETSHSPEDDQEKFPMEVSNASANLWPKGVLNSTEASNSHPSGTHNVSGNVETNPLHEWPSLQPKLRPLKLCLGNAPLSPVGKING
ncbi:hypothetical protein CEXT_708161 [Caerostris extrusa]|uniref:Prolactin receptor n=1 Tax=Caerostris extrusa TaxID=172846 RepID=A0AAV4NCK4_CAEEX|nr:hypothetical protein CEXT_708161 [Caerostris extrusa]